MAFPIESTTTVRVTQAGSNTAWMHHIAEVSIADVIPSTNLETDGLIIMRVFRDATNVLDTLTDTAFLLLADLHYQSDKEATPNKNYPFF
jgi:hypothetical protein